MPVLMPAIWKTRSKYQSVGRRTLRLPFPSLLQKQPRSFDWNGAAACVIALNLIQKLHRRIPCGIATGNCPTEVIDNLLFDISAVNKSTGRKVTGYKQIVNDTAIRAIGSGLRVNENTTEGAIVVKMSLHCIVRSASKWHQLRSGLKQLGIHPSLTHGIIRNNGSLQVLRVDACTLRQLLKGLSSNKYPSIWPGRSLIHFLKIVLRNFMGPKKLTGASPESI